MKRSHKIRLSDIDTLPCEPYLNLIMERYGKTGKFKPISIIEEVNKNDFLSMAEDLIWLDDMIFTPEFHKIVGEKLDSIFENIEDGQMLGKILVHYQPPQTDENFHHFVQSEDDELFHAECFSSCGGVYDHFWNQYFLEMALPNRIIVDIILNQRNIVFKKLWLQKLLMNNPKAKHIVDLIQYDEEFQDMRWYKMAISMNPSLFQIGKLIYMTKGLTIEQLISDFSQLGGNQSILDHVYDRLHYHIHNLKINRIFIK